MGTAEVRHVRLCPSPRLQSTLGMESNGIEPDSDHIYEGSPSVVRYVNREVTLRKEGVQGGRNVGKDSTEVSEAVTAWRWKDGE